MMRLIAIADSLYWIAGSLVVIGGFFVFVASTIKHLWDQAVERRAKSMSPTYNFQTNVDIYNIFFGPETTSNLQELPPISGGARPQLEAPVDLERIEPLLIRLLREDNGSAHASAEELARAWDTRELWAALELCTRATRSGVSAEMQVRCEAAADVLERALAVQRKSS